MYLRSYLRSHHVELIILVSFIIIQNIVFGRELKVVRSWTKVVMFLDVSRKFPESDLGVHDSHSKLQCVEVLALHHQPSLRYSSTLLTDIHSFIDLTQRS